MKWLLVLLALGGQALPASQEPAPPQQPILIELRVDGATVFTRDDIVWLLNAREGAPLPAGLTVDDVVTNAYIDPRVGAGS